MTTKARAPKSIAAATCGVLALVLFIVPLIGFGLAIAATVLGAKAIGAANASRGEASGGLGVAGLVCGIIGIPLGIVGSLLGIFLLLGRTGAAPYIYTLF